MISPTNRISQYCLREHRPLLDEYGLIADMSVTGNCLANAARASWNHIAKVEEIPRE